MDTAVLWLKCTSGVELSEQTFLILYRDGLFEYSNTITRNNVSCSNVDCCFSAQGTENKMCFDRHDRAAVAQRSLCQGPVP